MQQDLSRPDEAETPGGVPVHCYSLVETINYYRITGDEVKVPTPELNDPCGADNAKWVVPSNTKEISWELHKNAGLIAKANEGFHFSGKNGKEFKKIFGNPVGSGKQCPPPASTEWIDADSGTALRLAASGLHPDTDGKAIEGYVLIATIKEDFKVVNKYQKKTTKWLEEGTNKELQPGVDGWHPDEDKNDISNYELVSSTKDGGILVNVYRPVIATPPLRIR